MRRKLAAILLLGLCFSAAVISPAAAAQSYTAERYDVNVVIQADGSLNVTETVIFNFEGDPFTFVFRELTFNNLDRIDNVQVSMDGEALPAGTEYGQVEISRGQPLKVTWHFPPTSGARHEFTLAYRVLGAIRQDAGADTLFWRAIPEEHEYTIESSTIRVEYPAGTALLMEPSLDGPPAGIETGGQVVVFTTGQISENQAVDVSVRFPPNSLVSQPPAWQAQQEQARTRNRTALPFGLAAAALAGLLGIFAIVRGVRSFDRNDISISSTPYNLSAPPQPLPPALAARLTGSSTGFLGTLFDLARRGVVSVEEGPKKWDGRKFFITRQRSMEALRGHEDAFLKALFAKGESVPISAIGGLTGSSAFKKALEEDAAALGWIDDQRKSGRNNFLGIAAAGFVLGFVLFLLGVLVLNVAILPGMYNAAAAGVLLGGGAGLAAAGFTGMIAASVISPLSDYGARQAAAWKGYSGYLRQVSLGKEPLSTQDAFDTYLPFAAAFGIATAWAKFFQKQANVSVPAWFHGLQGSMDDGSYTAVMAAVSSADSTAASSAGGGAGGASGGGSSGAG